MDRNKGGEGREISQTEPEMVSVRCAGPSHSSTPRHERHNAGTIGKNPLNFPVILIQCLQPYLTELIMNEKTQRW